MLAVNIVCSVIIIAEIWKGDIVMCQVEQLIAYVISTKVCLYSEMFGDVSGFKYCIKQITLSCVLCLSLILK